MLGNALRINSASNVYWAGYYKGTADIDPGAGSNSVTATTGIDSYVTVLDNSGAYIMSETFPYLWGGFVVNSSNAIILTGKYSGTKDFAPGTPVTNMTTAGQTDACVVKLDPAFTAVKENSIQSVRITLYPNPNNGQFNINLKEESTVRIVNALGQTVLTEKFGQGINLIDIKEKGIYFLHMSDVNGKQTCTKFEIEN